MSDYIDSNKPFEYQFPPNRRASDADLITQAKYTSEENGQICNHNRICATCDKAVLVFRPSEECDRKHGADAMLGLVDCPEHVWRDWDVAYLPSGEKVTHIAGYPVKTAIGILIRHEHLAHVARDMYVAYRDILPILASFTGVNHIRSHYVLPDAFLRSLQNAGVSVDDVG